MPLHAANIGIAGSQTSHVLWQFENGAIDVIYPRVAVLVIGVDNMFSGWCSTADVARGISTCGEIRAACGQWHGVLLDWTGPVPLVLAAMTGGWRRVTVPKLERIEERP